MNPRIRPSVASRQRVSFAVGAALTVALHLLLHSPSSAAEIGCFGPREHCQSLAPETALRLADMVDAAQNQHPLVRGARSDRLAAGLDIETARRAYWPTLSVVTEASSTDQVTANRYLRVDQTVWDWGRNAARVNIAESTASAADAAIAVQRLNLGTQVIGAWADLVNAVLRRAVAQRCLDRLAELEAMMKRRVGAELSTPIDLELVRSRVTQADVERQVAEASARTAVTKLQQLTASANLAGPQPATVLIPSLEEMAPEVKAALAAEWEAIAQNQPTVLRARHEATTAQRRVDAKQAEAYPSVYVRLDQYLNGNRATAAVVGLTYTPGAGFSTFAEAKALAQRVTSSQEAVDAALFDVREVLYTDRNTVETGNTRLDAAFRAVRGAEVVRDSYERQFTAGKKSWLDLLNAVREVTQAEYSVADARASVLGAVGRLKLRAEQ